MRFHDTTVRVRYADTDQMGMVYYANYFVWFEVGRAEYMRAANLPYSDLERDGLHLPVIECDAQYKAPVRYDELIIVRTTVEDLSRLRIVFAYQVLRADDGKLAARGTTKHAFMDGNGRPRRLAADSPWWRRLQDAVK